MNSNLDSKELNNNKNRKETHGKARTADSTNKTGSFF